MRRLRPLPIALSALLAACATTPTPKPQAPAVQAPKPEPVRDITRTTSPTPRPNENGAGMWEQLRGSFQMADCDADPGISQWARRYTQNPQRFEDQLAAAAPRVAYVQQIAARHNVAGEFALLPWVESQYRPVAGGKNMPAGMWQIMPSTANAIGIRVNKNFDGRMDVPAATDAIMTLLSRYHDDLDDWRLVDYAFNAGEFGIKRMVAQHGAPPAEPVVPKMPVKAVTREHLVKLLAIACVIRDPDRFNVSLPSLPSEERLVTVAIDNSMPIEHAANRAGMSTDQLKDLNASFRNGMVDSSAQPYLLMPSNRVQQFQSSLLASSNDTAQNVPGTTVIPPLGAALGAATVGGTDSASTARSTGDKTHTVKSGESLWSIAHRYSLDVKQLQQWNHLQGAGVKPGQVLKVSAPS